MSRETPPSRKGMQQLGDVGNSPLALIGALFHPVGRAGRGAADRVDVEHMALLSWADLSYVMPVTAIGYVVTAFAARLLLGEDDLARRGGWASC